MAPVVVLHPLGFHSEMHQHHPIKKTSDNPEPVALRNPHLKCKKGLSRDISEDRHFIGEQTDGYK